MNTRLNDFIEMVFSGPPKEPCSYKVFVGNSTTQTLPYFMQILITGAKKLFGENIQPHNITESQFIVLQKYFKSFGYLIKYNYTVVNKTNNTLDHVTDISNVDKASIAKINIWFEDYKPLTTCQGITLY